MSMLGRAVSEGGFHNRDMENERAFDSPLQTSVHLLQELQGKLDRMHMRGDSHTATRMVEQVLVLLKSPDLLKHSTLSWRGEDWLPEPGSDEKMSLQNAPLHYEYVSSHSAIIHETPN